MNVAQYKFVTNSNLSDYHTHKIIGEAKDQLKDVRKHIAKLQDVMFADDSFSVLIGLQGMDTSGKDSLVKEVFKSVNVNGINVHSFKTPSSEELSHDYLWRHYTKLPERGKITVFNRTHYENILITRVHPEYIIAEKIPKYDSVEKISENFYHDRMSQINNFENHLVQNGILVIKIFLYLSKEEQKNRLLARLENEKKNWKFSAGDLKERKLWDKYMMAYEDMLKKTSTEYAPWYVVPADDKETARLIVAHIIKNKLEKLKLKYPELSDLEKNNLENYKSELKNS